MNKQPPRIVHEHKRLGGFYSDKLTPGAEHEFTSFIEFAAFEELQAEIKEEKIQHKLTTDFYEATKVDVENGRRERDQLKAELSEWKSQAHIDAERADKLQSEVDRLRIEREIAVEQRNRIIYNTYIQLNRASEIHEAIAREDRDFKLVSYPSMPEDEIHLRDDAGVLLGKITNLKGGGG